MMGRVRGGSPAWPFSLRPPAPRDIAMSDEKALLAAIRDHPDEDTPRLVYADWLQEHDQPERAEFIRVQIEAANLRWDDARWKELAERARQLLEVHGEEWIEPFRWLSPGGKFKA